MDREPKIIVMVNGESFTVRKTILSNDKAPHLDFDFLEHDGVPVTSTVLRDLFWNRYIGSVTSQLRSKS